ncbi:MAG: enoyl-CoA hydratase-related protein [Acidobacteriota bacterium]|nr:enoyl-CoA hydratase-related protein [Blastocatellia bacterium]MDW8240783.1 enoyl-CoA hydratase-related protein [Acidobacteriota bacterium]
MSNKIIIEQRGRVRIVSINRPEVHNCVDGETAVGLAEAIEAFAADAEARVLIVTGAGELAFCAGADLKNPMSLLQHRYTDIAGPMGFARLDPGKPTIAAINGYCFAGGFELAAWCDFRIAAANAEFGCLSRRWGVPYTDGGTQRFARIMGLGNALYLLETGARIDAWRAQAMGFVQEVVPQGQALPRALELATCIASYPNFAGMCADRHATLATYGLSLDEGLKLEAQIVRPTLASDEMIAGLERFRAGARDASPRPPSHEAHTETATPSTPNDQHHHAEPQSS